MISTVIEALCVGIMCTVCYKIGWNKGADEARHVIMMILQRGEQDDQRSIDAHYHCWYMRLISVCGIFGL